IRVRRAGGSGAAVFAADWISAAGGARSLALRFRGETGRADEWRSDRLRRRACRAGLLRDHPLLDRGRHGRVLLQRREVDLAGLVAVAHPGQRLPELEKSLRRLVALGIGLVALAIDHGRVGEAAAREQALAQE